MGAILKAIEYYLPEIKVTNFDLQQEFPDYNFEKFGEKVGIQSRFISNIDETALDLAIKACNKLFERINKNDIDFIIYCTQSPEYILPTTACILQDRISLNKNIGALDYNLGCSGYTYGLAMAKALINSNISKNVLLVTAETYSKYINKTDMPNRAIFGDGATASLISYSEYDNFGEFVFGTNGAGFDKLIIHNGGTKNKNSCIGNPAPADDYLYMNGPEVFNFTIEEIPKACIKLLEKNNQNILGIDQFIFHQANSFMLNHLRKLIGIEKEKFFNDLREEGNTVSNSIPIALKKYSETLNEFPKKIILFGFGVGLSWCGGQINLINKL